MFFQNSTEDAANKAPVAVTDFSKVKAELEKSLQTMTDLKDMAGNVFKIFEELILASDELNKTFVGGRLRMQEMSKAINEAAPGIARLGGEYKDISTTISEIAAGTRTQVVATTKDITQLYAASEVIGSTVKEIVTNFDQVGYSYNTIADNLAKSIVYVQGVGQNARAVMKDVVANTEQLSRFNFANGVQGLTKMAAQATMMRFDMKNTFDFADKLLDPEGAIEMASAFQRLGVSVGNLTDPLSLVNQSLTDPSGLQTSLINMTKQFTYFDEQTKSFKINPQGILTMRELSTATGISAAELRKTALAAAEMDSKLAKINTTGLNFEVSEENKMLIANVARMGEGGEYEVNIKDERGYEYQKKLTELQEQDFKKIIEQQSKAPKTIEEIQQSQLNTAELTLGEIKGLKETMTSYFFQLPNAQENLASAVSITRDSMGAFQRVLNSGQLKGEIEKVKEEEKRIRTTEPPEKQKALLDELFKKAKENIFESAESILSATGIEMGESRKKAESEQVKGFLDKIGTYFDSIFGDKGTTKEKSTQFNILSTSYSKPIEPNAPLTAALNLPKLQGQLDVEFTNPTLTVNVNVTAPSGMDSSTLTQIIKDGQLGLQQEIYNAVKKVSISKGEIKPVVG